MANHDYNIANDTHANVRSDLNNALAAIRTFNSVSGFPATIFPNMIAANTSTTPNLYYVRNAGDSAWASLFTDTGLIRSEDGAVTAVGIGFRQTAGHGMYRIGATSYGFAVAGVNSLTLGSTAVSFNAAAGDIDFAIGATGGGANSFFVQGSDGFMGLGTGAPAFQLHGQYDASGQWTISSAIGASSGSYITLRKSRGTHASPAALSSGDFIGRVQASAYHSTGTPGFVISGREEFFTDGAESGDTVPTAWRVYTMPSGGSLTERMRVNSNGAVGIGKTAGSARALEIGGLTALYGEIVVEHHANNTLPPFLSLYKSRGTAVASPADVQAGDNMGALTYNGYLNSDWRSCGRIQFMAHAVSGSVVQPYMEVNAANTAGTLIQRFVTGDYVTLTDGVATTLFTMACANNTCAGGILHYFVEALDASNVVQVEVGEVPISVVNTAGTVTTDIGTGHASNLTSSGTLTVTVAASAANPSVISVNANTSLTSTLLRCIYSFQNLSNQGITIS